MADVAKVIELVGSSSTGWEDAAARAVKAAAVTLHGITGIEVTNMTAKVENGEIVNYKTTVKVAFGVDG
ncbi:MAG: dodecin domain-containing protein [Caldilineales bacterium]|nr:dodecin domain-containing protein [Caldilineales bacterium]